ncbi:hypothetical protein ABT026_16755 [Streptomyces sp. NPDC002734]|uniref:hypothetical protein n=1 Tax=Streptomyces sp. NPDC002734 TaxID=3154426 RepID=UPI00331C31C2
MEDTVVPIRKQRPAVVRERYEVRFSPSVPVPVPVPVPRVGVGRRVLAAALLWTLAVLGGLYFLGDGVVMLALLPVAAGGFLVGGAGLVLGLLVRERARGGT